MKEQDKRLELLASAPVPRALLTLGLPTMVGMMINALYNLADAYFIGGLGTGPLGAVTVAYPLGQVVVGVGLLFGNGAASCLSRSLGKGDREQANRIASTALYSSLLAGAALILAALVFLQPLLKLLGATEGVLPYAAAYGRVYLAGSLFNVFNVAMNNIVSSEGAAKTTMCVLLVGAALNVILDPLFIYGLGLEVTGAALATALSQLVSTLIYLRYIRAQKSMFRFAIGDFCPSREILSGILQIGVPTLVFQILTSLSMALTNTAAGAYGDSVLAAMGPVSKVMSVGSLMVFGFLKGLQPVAGYSYGAKNYDRLQEAVRTATLWSTGFCAIFGVGAALSAPRLLAQFTADDAVLLQTGQAALRANGGTFIVFGFYTVYSFLLLALGKAGEGLFLGICRQGVCFVPAILLLPAVWGLNGILYAQPAADLLAAAIAGGMALRLRRELVREQAKAATE